MRFAMLGPLEISGDDGTVVAVSRRLHRHTLSLLLLSAGQPCSAGDLISGLWGDEPPLSPDVSLRSCVYGIRKLLPDPGRLRTHAAGYLITAGPGELDLHDFRDLARRGRAALDDGDPELAATLLADAVGLWREPPLADLPPIAEKERLIGQFNEAQDALMDARLALGRHRQALGELRSVVAADPLREHAWAQLILALYRSGARAEALGAFGRLRMTLVSAYGIEPGPELQDLHRQVLTDDPALMSWAGKPAQLRPAFQQAAQPPCQLPAAVPDFTGREAELAELRGRLSGDGMPVTVLTGMPGAGKTALAVRAAHQVRASFPDGQLYALLDDAGRARDPQVVLAELLRGIGVPPDTIPAAGFEREALYRSALAGRRVLVLADGASSAAQVRPLLPGTPGSAVLVTSRARLADLDGVRLIEIGGLPPADSARLVSLISGRRPAVPLRSARPVRAEDVGPQSGRNASARTADAGYPGVLDPLMSIAAACGYLPLALRIAGARLAADPDLDIADLARLLADETQLLDQLVVGDISVRARLAAAVQSAGGPARRVLALLAASPRDTPGPLIGTLLDEPDARLVAMALANAGLLRRVTGGAGKTASYRMHPLVRCYARELLADADPGMIGSATGRLLAFGWLERASGQEVVSAGRREALAGRASLISSR